MKKRLLVALLALCMLMTACATIPQNSTEGSTEPSTTPEQTQAPSTDQSAEGEDEEKMDLFAALFPEADNIPKKKEIVSIVKELADNTSRISEINYTWKNGKKSMEILSGTHDEYEVPEAPAESPLQLVYGESTLYNYVLYLPEGYDPADTETKWPVIYFFHGIGESGSNLEDLLPYGVLKYLNAGGKVDAIIIAPQCPGDSHWADTDVEEEKLVQFVPEMTAKYNIDTNRMYLTGLSMGGRCTWKLALAMPDTFAAIAVVCGRTNTYEFDTINDMPIWMFHGAQDGTVSFDNINKILPLLAQNDHRYYKLTVYPHMGHDIWNTVYARAEVYDWLLAQSLSNNQAETEK